MYQPTTGACSSAGAGCAESSTNIAIASGSLPCEIAQPAAEPTRPMAVPVTLAIFTTTDLRAWSAAAALSCWSRISSCVARISSIASRMYETWVSTTASRASDTGVTRRERPPSATHRQSRMQRRGGEVSDDLVEALLADAVAGGVGSGEADGERNERLAANERNEASKHAGDPFFNGQTDA